MKVIENELDCFLSNERFKFSRRQTKEAIVTMKNKGLDSSLLEQILEEDFILEVKYNAYKRNLKKIIFALFSIIIGVCLIILKIESISFFLIVFGIMVFVSSIFGITTNRISKIQKQYLEK